MGATCREKGVGNDHEESSEISLRMIVLEMFFSKKKREKLREDTDADRENF